VRRLQLDIHRDPDSAAARASREFVANSEQQLKAKGDIAGADAQGLFDVPALWSGAYDDECDSAHAVVAGEVASMPLDT